ncbi:MAG: pilin [Betaproteobacteria bacterium]
MPVAIAGGRTATLQDDTIQIPRSTLGGDGPVVRPTLAVLFRLAVGPAADYYTPRFLNYERAGYGTPGWHWPALLFQCLWAFYRNLWLLGVFYALLTAAGAMTFVSLAENIDDWSLPWLVCAGACIWLGPGIVAALVSTPLLYTRIRRLVRRAEGMSRDAATAASLLAARPSTSWHDAVLFGGAALIMALGPVAPTVHVAYQEHAVREKISQSLRATLPLQQEIEARWSRFTAIPRAFDGASLVALQWSHLLDDVNVSPITGRVRLGLGPSIPELWGKTILLAPATDWLQRIHWTCIPIDIPKRFLPKECRPS